MVGVGLGRVGWFRKGGIFGILRVVGWDVGRELGLDGKECWVLRKGF